METKETLPNFLLIGVAKAGTSWIFEVLREHPQVFVPEAKDLFFFDRYFEKGLEWYGSFFAEVGECRAIGELCHDYYLSEVAAQRISETLPEARLICSLREPVDKLISGYRFNRTTEYSGRLSFDKYVQLPEITRQFEYAQRLEPFLERFPRDRVLVLFFEDLKRDPSAFARKLFAFLEVDESFEPTCLEQKVNPARDARLEPLAHLAYRVAARLRKAGMANFVGKVKHNPYFQRLLYKQASPEQEISEVTLRRLRGHYRSTYAELEQLIGQPLPPEWYRHEQ